MELVGQPGDGTAAGQLSLPLRSITPDYFDVMGMGIVDGRGFQPTETNKAPMVAVVNQAFARRYFPGAAAIGRQMRFAGDAKRAIADRRHRLGHENRGAERDRPSRKCICRFWQSGAFSKHLVVRAAGDPGALSALVRREVHAVDPTASVERFITMAQIRRNSIAPRTFAMRLLIGFAVLATALALVGHLRRAVAVGGIAGEGDRRPQGGRRAAPRHPAADPRRGLADDRRRHPARRRRGHLRRARARELPVRRDGRAIRCRWPSPPCSSARSRWSPASCRRPAPRGPICSAPCIRTEPQPQVRGFAVRNPTGVAAAGCLRSAMLTLLPAPGAERR